MTVCALLVGSCSFLLGSNVLAKAGDQCGFDVLADGQICCDNVPTTNCCGGVETSIINCTQTGGGNRAENTGIWGVLLLAINILTAGVGVAAVGGIVYSSILYTTAGGSPEQAKKARTVIVNTVVGMITYALMFSFLNFIIPGGMFSTSTTSPSSGTPAAGPGQVGH